MNIFLEANKDHYYYYYYHYYHYYYYYLLIIYLLSLIASHVGYWYGELSVMGWETYRKKSYVLLLTVSILLTLTHYFAS